MSRRLLRLRWLPVLACALLMVCILPAIARAAETYGEVAGGGFVGKVGAGHKEFKITLGTHAFGVDTTDNSVYVGDEPKKGEYRIQKLTASGTFLAQTALFKPPNHDGIEGIAVDAAQQRLYVLALEKRGEALTIGPSMPAAGTLYAFSSEQSGETLPPATGTSEGVLTGPEAFASQSDTSEAALLEPRGIAVDPSTHDVIVLGEVGLKVEGEKEPRFHVALQRIHSSGVLGNRYVDAGDFFSGLTPNSPVVSTKGAVYVTVDEAQTNLVTGVREDELIGIPSEFASQAPPSPFLQLTLRGTFEEEGKPVVEFDEGEPTADGDGLSFAPEAKGGAGEGTIYARAQVFVGTIEEGSYYPGVLAFAGAGGSEIGWTGGQTKKAGTSCAIAVGGITYPSVAAGSNRTVFMFDPGKTSPFNAPRVVEFGPEGKGCPAAEASEPVATVNGQPLSPSEQVSPGTPVTFSSTMTQANAVSVEWSFGDGQTTTSPDQYQHTEVTHKFVRGGELTVTETIHTDDLATPTIVKQTKIAVSITASPPTAVLEGPSEVILGGGGTPGKLVYLEGGGLGLEESAESGEAAFDASASSASTATGPNQIDAYHWVFGDGQSETTTGATTKHKYDKAGAYKVELTVTDTLGSTSEPSSLNVKVLEPAPKAPPVVEESAGGTPSTPSTQTPTGLGGGLGAPASVSPSPVPAAGLVSTSLTVGITGTIGLDVTCPSGESSCTGTIVLRTLGVVVATTGRGVGAKKHKASVLTLATGRFTVTGGHTKSIKLRLSAGARALLARFGRLRARATIAAHDPAGSSHTTQTTVTLRIRKDVRSHGSRWIARSANTAPDT
jgi:PKD repeat protein